PPIRPGRPEVGRVGQPLEPGGVGHGRLAAGFPLASALPTLKTCSSSTPSGTNNLRSLRRLHARRAIALCCKCQSSWTYARGRSHSILSELCEAVLNSIVEM